MEGLFHEQSIPSILSASPAYRRHERAPALKKSAQRNVLAAIDCPAGPASLPVNQHAIQECDDDLRRVLFGDAVVAKGLPHPEIGQGEKKLNP